MNLYPSSHRIKPDLSRAEATPALTVYVTALSAYQRQRTPTSRAVLSQSYQRWIRSFLDNEDEAKRATISFMATLRNQPSQLPEMDAAA